MSQDLTTYILATALLCGSGGFYAACLICARRIRRAELEGWKSAIRHYQDQALRAAHEARR